MNRIPLFAALVVIGGGALVFAQKPVPGGSSAKITTQDQTFLQNVIRDNQMEIDLGRLAGEKASDAMVKGFGEKLVSDHTANQKQLETLASRVGASVPSSAGSSKPSEPDYQKLSKMSGSSFDRAFAMQMIQDHQKAIATFEQELNSTTNPDIQSYINMTLPVLRSHLSTAQSLERSLGKG